MLVWKAIESISPMISPICCEASEIADILRTTWCITSPLSLTRREACSDSWLACWALLEFCSTVVVICSMLLAVCCSEAAWSSVRAARAWLPLAMSWLADDTLWMLRFTSRAMLDRLLRMVSIMAASWPISLRPKSGICALRLPAAICELNCIAAAIGALIERRVR